MKRKSNGSAAAGPARKGKRPARADAEQVPDTPASFDPQYESLGEDGSEMDGGFEDLEAGDGAFEADEVYESEAADSEMDGGFVDLEAEGAEDGESELAAEGGDGDEEEDELEAQGAAPTNGTESQRKGKKVSSLYAIPTNAEMQGLKETSELFKNNVIKLQIEELVSEVRPGYEMAGALHLVLRRLHSLLEGLPSFEPAPLSSAISAAKKHFKSFSATTIPFAEPAPRADAPAAQQQQQHKFGFAPPEGLQLIGSWPLKSATKRPDGLDVDVAVIMPSSLFQEKDHMNLRYAHKRAFFLAVVAAAIQEAAGGAQSRSAKGKGKQSEAKEALPVELAWELLDADPRRPVLVLTPRRDGSDADFSKLRARIRLHPAYDPATAPFNFGRLAPSRNAIRVNVATAGAAPPGAEAGADAQKDSLPPTPLYNTTVLLDGLALAHLVYLHKTAQACASFQDACALLKTWAFQRGFGSGTGRKRKGASHAAEHDPRYVLAGSAGMRFVLTMMLAHLLQGEARKGGASASARLSHGLSSYQLFRGLLDWLSKHDFGAAPVAMRHIEGIPSLHAKIPLEDFGRHFDYSLVDPTGSVNLLAFLPAGSLDKLKLEAQRTLALLADSSSSAFDHIFLSDLSAPFLTADEVIELPDSGALRLAAAEGDDATLLATVSKADAGSHENALVRNAVANFKQGFGDRIKAVSISCQPVHGHLLPLDAFHDAAYAESELSVVLSYNIEQALRIVDHGPAPTEAEAAAAYRKFWGDTAELRRFKDGRVLESIVWKAPAATRRWDVPRQIARSILKRHHGLEPNGAFWFGSGFDGLLDVDRSLSLKAHLSSPQEKGFGLLQAAHADFSKAVRATDMPLSLSSITPTSAALRGMSTFVPAPLNLKGLGSRVPDVASYLPAHDVVLAFESSGRWPDDLVAIQAMKAAFFERLATSIADKLAGCLTRLVFDDEAPELADRCALEVITPTGYAFHARIHHDRERVLLERIVMDKAGESASRRRTARDALELHEVRFIQGTRHHMAMNILSHKFAALPETVRYAKRWLAAQMCGSQIAEESVELICAAIFLAQADAAPASGPAGLVQFLSKLASWNWREEPMLVPLFTATQASDEVKAAVFPEHVATQVEQAFQRIRSSDPSIAQRAWYIATEQDVHGSPWSGGKPSAMWASTLRQLARGSIEILKSTSASSAIQQKTIFTPPQNVHDFYIHLQPHLLSRYCEAVSYSDTAWDDSLGKNEYRNLSASSQRGSTFGREPRPGFDTLSAFASLLETHYGDSFRILFDVHGGTCIAGIWNPFLSNERPYKVALGFSSEPVLQDGPAAQAKAKSVRINKSAILAEIERLGGDLIDRIEVNVR